MTPWWKKEITLRRRPRGTVVVPNPVLSPELVERAAAIFELERETPAVLEPSIWPVEPLEPSDEALATAPAPAALPPVWPPALIGSGAFVDPGSLEAAPRVELEPVAEAAAGFETEAPYLSEVEEVPLAHLPVQEEPAFSFPPLVFPPLVSVEPPEDEPSEPEVVPAANVTPLFGPPDPVEDAPVEQTLLEEATIEQAAFEQAAVEQAAGEQAAVEQAPKKPLLKRELHLPRRKAGRRTKEGKEAKDRAGAKRARAAARSKGRRPRQSIWERSLSLPRLRRPDAPVKLIGLRVGSTQLAAAHVSNNGSIEVLQLARSPLRAGVVVGGEVREPDALAAELKAFFTRHKLPRKNVRLGVASSRIGVRVLELPVIDDPKAFANAIRFRAQELLPIPVTDAVLDHLVLGEYVSSEGSPMCRVLLAFAHRDLVARYADACQKAGVKLAGIDLDAFALLRSLSEPRAEEAEATQAVVAVAIGHERTVFAVSDGLICDFVRVLEWGGGALDSALSHSLDLSLEGAHEAKHQLVLLDDSGAVPDGLSAVQVEAARATVRDELRVLSHSIVESLRYYQTRDGSLAIGEILVTGGTAELPGLVEELERLVGVPVRAADPLLRVQLGKKVKRPAEAGSFAVAIGLGIES